MGCCEKVFTPQEDWLEKGFMTNTDPKRERTFKRLDAVRKTPIMLCTDRAKYFTESMRETEDKPMELRYALALKNMAEKMPVYIGPDDLIVGRVESRPGRCGTLHPEVDGGYMNLVGGANLCDRADAAYIVPEEDRRVLDEEVAPYWNHKSFPEAYEAILPEETRRVIYGPNKDNIYYQAGIVFSSGNNRSSQNWVTDWEKVIKRGMKAIKEDAQKRLDAIDHPRDLMTKGVFLNSCIISCDAIVTWANRYADEAERQANDPATPEARRAELQKIAKICRRVPEYPAETFQEALQSEWFAYMFTRLEQLVAGSLSLGRLDQILYPYYKKDIEEGRITRDEARELLESTWVNMSEAMVILVSPAGGSFTEGYAHFEGVTIGGQLVTGEDATNDLSYLILESKQGVPINYPDLAVRIHAGTPDKFLHKVVEVIKDGQGYPKLFNDEEIVPMYLAKGVPYEKALDYVVTGCAEHRVPNFETYIHPGGVVNAGSVLEMVLHNGRVPKYGDTLMGLETGDPREFKTFEEFFEAYKKQHIYMEKQALVQQRALDVVFPKYLACPFTSMLHDLAYEQCEDLHGNVTGGMREAFVDICGLGTFADSMAAIDTLVYKEKKFTMDELIKALDADFEGYEVIQQLCLNAPKYGNDDPYVDGFAREIERFHCDYLETQVDEPGEVISLRFLPITLHIALGKIVGATPNGRKATTPLSEGTGATHGCDTHGPTGLLASNAHSKTRGIRNRQARLLNMKLSPGTVAGEEGTRRMMSLVRSWCDLKINHIQFNIINQETLQSAKKEPDKYRNLVVRVAGYSAYFTELSPELQDEIIARTEHEAV
mgnify:CR=1 FL=1